MPKTSAQARPINLTQTLRRLLSYMGHAKFSLLAVGVLASVAAIASLAGTYMVRPIVNGLATGGEELLARQVIFTAAIYAAGVLSALGYSQIMVRAAQRVVSDIRRDLFAHIQMLPLSYFDSTRSGDIMSFFTNDVDTVSEALNNSFANVIQASIQMVRYHGYAHHPQLAAHDYHARVRCGHCAVRALLGHAFQALFCRPTGVAGRFGRIRRGDGLGPKGHQGL